MTLASDFKSASRNQHIIATNAPVVLDITGMTCAACAGRIESALAKIPGVARASVNLALERAEIATQAGGATSSDLVAAIERIGYGAQARASTPAARRHAEAEREADRLADERQTLALLVASAALTIPLVMPMLLAPLGATFHINPWVQFALATPVQFVIGARFYRAAWKAMKAFAANMDLLVALGTSAAYAFSVVMLLRKGSEAGPHLYFEAAAAVVTFVILGKWLEARAKRGATAAIRALAQLRPQTARVMRDGVETEILIDAVKAGDRVVIRPGERFAVDGQIEDGASEVDESLLTGESVPVAKRPGDGVTAGALNGAGRLVVNAVGVGEDTTLARIIRMVENAQTGKAPVQRLVDRVSAVFVPAVIAIAIGAFFGWLAGGQGFEAALISAVSVLVIACPCALGLATPAALVTGTGAAARAGILVKDIDALERTAQVNDVVFDKTGTLTQGLPAVMDVATAPGVARDELLRLAAAVQAGSEHPLARAVLAAAPHDAATVTAHDIRAEIGRGVTGMVNGKTIAIGNRSLMQDRGVDLSPVDAALSRIEAAAHTAVVVAQDSKALGVLGIADQVRPEAAQAVRELTDRGVAVHMLTGDAEPVARAVAAALGITSFKAAVKPHDKAAAMRTFATQGRHVAMVGDGINDAPALAAADIGFALRSGTDVAVAAAGVTLMTPDMRLVPAALDIAQRTVSKIRQNLFWAFGYNVIGIPLAAMGFLTPAVAGAAMALSSVSVVANSLLLRRWRPDFHQAQR